MVFAKGDWPNRRINLLMLKSFFKIVKDQAIIVDIGCGTNWVKEIPYSKNYFITGIDPEESEADFKATITSDDMWCKEHQNFFDAGVALNSLNFASTEGVIENIVLAMNLLKKDSYLYLTLNQARIDKRDKVVTTSESDLVRKHENISNLIKEIFTIKVAYLYKNEGLNATICGHHHFILHKD
jgi:hypothetical protein